MSVKRKPEDGHPGHNSSVRALASFGHSPRLCFLLLRYSTCVQHRLRAQRRSGCVNVRPALNVGSARTVWGSRHRFMLDRR